MILRGYIDESFSGKQREGIFTLCCVFVQENMLAWLEMAWAKVITETNATLSGGGRPEIKRYHAAECNSRSGDFAGWPEDERNTFVLKLFHVIRLHRTSHLAFSVDLKELLEIWPEGINDAVGFAYTTLLKYIMLEIGKVLQDERMSEKIELIYERGDHDADIEAAFANLMADSGFQYKQAFLSIERSDWQRSVLLQLADLLAYESYKESDRHMPGRTRGRRKSLEELLSFDSFGARSLSISAEAIKEIKRMHIEAVASRTKTAEEATTPAS
jgi:hypothetical protein